MTETSGFRIETFGMFGSNATAVTSAEALLPPASMAVARMMIAWPARTPESCTLEARVTAFEPEALPTLSALRTDPPTTTLVTIAWIEALSDALTVTLRGRRRFTESAFVARPCTPSTERDTVGTMRSPDDEVRLVESQPASAAARPPTDSAPGTARRTK